MTGKWHSTKARCIGRGRLRQFQRVTLVLENLATVARCLPICRLPPISQLLFRNKKSLTITKKDTGSENRNQKIDLLGACGWCFYPWSLLSFFVNERGYETPDNLKGIVPRTVDAIIYGKEDPVGGNPSFYERLMSYNILGGNKDPEEAQSKADSEADRLANWKDNLPHKPTTDLGVVITEETIKVTRPSSPAGIQWMPERVL